MKYKLSEIMDMIGGGTPKTSNPDYWNGDIPWLSVKDFGNDYRYVYESEKHITKLGLENSSTKLLQRGDIIISARGTVGEIATIPYPMAFNQSCYGLRAKKEIVTEDFLYYLIKHSVRILKRNTHGSVFDTITRDTFETIEVDVPSISDQIKIASILGDLDSKIVLNNRINNNLLEQAQALFKSWFIEFAPFGYEMPGSWNEGTLQDIAEFSNGYAFASNELLDEEAPDTYHVFKQGHIVKGGGFNSSGTKSWYPRSKATSLGKFVLRKGDILMAMTDMKGNVQILGNTAIMEVDNQYIVNQRVGVLRCKSETGVAFPYLFLLTNSFDFLSDLRGRANSGVQVNLSASAIKNSVVQIAPKQVYEEFNTIVLPLFEAMISNDLENQRLAELRNTLLPKLMSGELDVSNVEI